MRILGQLEQKVYIDDFEDVPPDDLADFYDIDESDQPVPDNDPNEPVGDNPTDNDPAPTVPKSHYPFLNIDLENLFCEALEEVHEQEIIPAGYNILSHELEEGGYLLIEVIHIEWRGQQEITVGLADEIWHPQAIKFHQSHSPQLTSMSSVASDDSDIPIVENEGSSSLRPQMKKKCQNATSNITHSFSNLAVGDELLQAQPLPEIPENVALAPPETFMDKIFPGPLADLHREEQQSALEVYSDYL
ncbi:hypothetical protein QCA50_017545 [Cerrena zonata]|uniref:Uncharacterized protein n=1 Tax=Cerrena zonata TaxID=2478898 RepID=A0AAW0FFZ1_9APHY